MKIFLNILQRVLTEETLLRKHCCENFATLMFPGPLRVLETFVGKIFFAFEQQKLFLSIFRNICLPQQIFLARANKATLLRKQFIKCFNKIIFK